MKIVVCVKHVPDAQADRRFEDDLTVDRTGVDGLLSELDEYAVEAALTLAETLDGGPHSVTALTMGPADAAAAVRRALQMGADEGAHVLDDALAGSDAPATSLVLGQAVRELGFDLVLTGMASTDGVMGVVPSMLAERLGVPQLTLASRLSIEPVADGSAADGLIARIERDGDTATEVLQAPLPAVVSVTDQINEPRYPSFKGIMAAKKKPVRTFSLAELGIDPADVGLAAAWTEVLDAVPRPPRQAGRIVTDEGDGGRELAEFLASAKLL